MSTIANFTPAKLKAWIETYALSGVSTDAGNVLELGTDGLVNWDGDYNDLTNTPPAGDFLPISGGTLTGDLQGVNIYGGSDGTIATGVGSGSVGMTINDGSGNANITFNHIDGIADQDGNSFRIKANTDALGNAKLSFETLGNVTAGAVSTIERFAITDTGVTATVDIAAPTFTEGGTALSSKYLPIASPAFTGTLSGPTVDISSSVSSPQFYADAANGNGLRLWNGNANYAVHMSSATDATYGGRVSGETTSDYNMYFTMTGGTNRGFNFRDGNTSGDVVAGIDSLGTYRTTATTQAFNVSTNYGQGQFGLYSATRYQHVWSMGAAYKTAADGTGYGNMYGLTWTHTNVGTGANEAISGLSHQLQVRANGTLWCAFGNGIWSVGNITAYSDRRVKTNIEHIPDALEKVCQLNGYTFDRTDIPVDPETGIQPETRQTGVIAQEVLEVLPEAVTGTEEGHYSVAYGNMVGLLIEAIKEQQVQIDDLKNQLNP